MISRLSRWLAVPVALAAAAVLSATPAHAADVIAFYLCNPTTPSANAFPFAGFTSNPPYDCDGNYSWGYTEAFETGHAEWRFVATPGWQCRIHAFLPNEHTTDSRAQYFIYDGSRYLGNDAFVDQNRVGDGWSGWFLNGTYFTVTDRLRITLSDKNPGGVTHAQISTSALEISCR